MSVWSLSRDGVLVSSCMFAEVSVLHGEMQPEAATQRWSPHLVFSPRILRPGKGGENEAALGH